MSPQWIQWYDHLGSDRMQGYESAPVIHYMYFSCYQGNLMYWTSSYVSLFWRDLLLDVLDVFKTTHYHIPEDTDINWYIAYVYSIISMNIHLDYSACVLGVISIFSVFCSTTFCSNVVFYAYRFLSTCCFACYFNYPFYAV